MPRTLTGGSAFHRLFVKVNPRLFSTLASLLSVCQIILLAMSELVCALPYTMPSAAAVLP